MQLGFQLTFNTIQIGKNALMHKAEKQNNFSSQLQQQKMHVDDILNNQFQL